MKSKGVPSLLIMRRLKFILLATVLNRGVLPMEGPAILQIKVSKSNPIEEWHRKARGALKVIRLCLWTRRYCLLA